MDHDPADDPARRGDVPPPPPDGPTPPLHIVAFAGPGETPVLDGLLRGLGEGGDHVLLRQPGPHWAGRDLGPQVRTEGVEQLPGVKGELGPLLRLDGLPSDADIILGYGHTAGIADVRLDAYPEARVVQLLDAAPVDRQHLEVLARADLIVTVGPDVAHQTRARFDELGFERVPPIREVSLDNGGRGLHDAVHALGDDVARVDDAAWGRELSPREVVLRHAGEAVPAEPGRPRVMTTFVAWSSEHGGGATANREMAESFAAAGAEVYARVPSTGDPARQAFVDPVTGAHVVGVREVWGVHDARALLMLPDNLPPDVDVIVGHSRFSGGAAVWLAEHVYPNARYVHVLHSLPEQLDALRGTPDEGVQHAQTERALMSRADLVVGVGPLLADEAVRLSGGPPPPVHTMISDMPASPGEPHRPPPDQRVYRVLVQGRLDDNLKGVQFVSRVIGELRAEGWDVRLVARGAPAHLVELQERQLSAIVGEGNVEVRMRTTNPHELLADIHGADLVVMPSVHEGFGLVASEAARAGVPVFVGQGTGAGLFFADRAFVSASLGEPAVVRDGVTVQAVWDALARSSDPQAAVAHLDEGRLPVWVDHLRLVLDNLPAHSQRAVDLRAFLDSRYPVGSAGRAILDMLGFGEVGGEPSPSTPSGSLGGHVVQQVRPEAADRTPVGAVDPTSTRLRSPSSS